MTPEPLPARRVRRTANPPHILPPITATADDDLLTLLDHLGDAAIAVNREWRIVAHSTAARGLLTQTAATSSGELLWNVWPAAAERPLAEQLRGAMAKRAPARVEHHERAAPARDVWLDIHIVPSADGLLIVAVDISERKRHAEQARQLQELTAALSAALDPNGVGAAIIARAMPTLGANAGNVFLLDSNDRELRNVALLGYEPEIQEWSRRLSLDGPTMVADVVRTGAPILLSTWEERVMRYPHHRTVHASGGDRAVAGLPLQVEGRTIGALSLAFPTDRDFTENDRLFMATVADLCAQALERARLYETVRISETRFRQLADTMPQIVWVIDAGGTTLEYLNKRWFDYTGTDPTIGTAAEANAPIHPDDRPQAEAQWIEAIRTGEPYSRELRLRAADGSYRWFLSRCVAVRDRDGRIGQWFGTSTDIDDTKRTEARQRFLAELGRTLAASLDPEETLRHVTRLLVPAFADYCVVDLLQPDGLLRRVAWAHIDRDEQRHFEERLAQDGPLQLHDEDPISRTLATGEAQFVPVVTDAWLQRIAPSLEYLELMRGCGFRSQITAPLRARDRTQGTLTLCFTDDSGRHYTLDDLELGCDVAERVALAVANAQLYTESRDAEAKVRRLLDAGVIGVIVVDADHILEANGHFLDMVGYTREELESGRLRWPAMTPPEYAELDARAIAELDERGVCTPFEKEYIRRDGSRIPILIGAAVLQHEAPLWICFILDLTQRKRDEEEWRAFVDATAHDLRNPLTAVLGQTQLLQRRLRRERSINSGDGESRLAAIAAAASRAAGLIDDLMDTVRLRAGQPLDFRPNYVELCAMVVSCAEEARRIGPSHDIRVETEAADLVIHADGPRIERVVRNMLDNAIKYSPAGGDVRITMRREEGEAGQWAILSIQDRGIGIPAADLPHVFDRFRRGGNVAGRIAGSGIGLTGAQQIVAQHGGTLTAESTEGEGSTFTMRLPLVADGDGKSVSR